MKNNKFINFIFFLLFIFVVSFALYYVISDEKKKNVDNGGDIISDVDEEIEVSMQVLDMDDSVDITINNKKYVLKLENNKTSFDLLSIAPLTVEMSDLNNNEKYVYLSLSLNEEANYSGSIKKGDVMLYQSNCLVIFYKDFETNYHYTKIGHIDNLPSFDSKNIKVTIG